MAQARTAEPQRSPGEAPVDTRNILNPFPLILGAQSARFDFPQGRSNDPGGAPGTADNPLSSR
jgi:hypothetical protein